MRVICVYKTGGDFDRSYVMAMMKQLDRYMPTPMYRFTCLTDDHDLLDIPMIGNFIEFLPLQPIYKGWWNKVQMFRFANEPCIFFDLDTIIVGDLAPLVQLAEERGKIFMLGTFNPKRLVLNSGVMAWNGKFTNIDKDFLPDYHPQHFRGDQDYIYHTLKASGVNIGVLQNHIDGIYSYKKNILLNKNELPGDATIICFHGLPRPRHAHGGRWMNQWKEDYSGSC